MRRFLIGMVGTLFLAIPAHAEPFRATIYELGSQRQKVLFTMEATEHNDGDETVRHSVFRDPAGNDLVTEDVRMKDWHVDRYDLNYVQKGENGNAELRNGKVFFQYFRKGKSAHDSEDLSEAFLVPPNTIDYIKSQWSHVLAGETIYGRFGILDHTETVGFKFFKDRDVIFNGRPAVVLKMKPTSIFIAALVNPLYITLDAENQRLLEIVGRTLPKVHIGDDWHDIEADTIFEYASPASPPTSAAVGTPSVSTPSVSTR